MSTFATAWLCSSLEYFQFSFYSRSFFVVCFCIDLISSILLKKFQLSRTHSHMVAELGCLELSVSEMMTSSTEVRTHNSPVVQCRRLGTSDHTMRMVKTSAPAVLESLV